MVSQITLGLLIKIYDLILNLNTQLRRKASTLFYSKYLIS